VREIATTDLFSVGNHTATHARLSDLDTREATAEEVLGAKERLEAVTHKPVDRFSYPSEPGLVTPSTSPYRLPRIDACLPLDLLRFETTDLGDRLRRSARRLGESLP
jgi:peptidoglycan/xylan/chitin deacetylase (PgdA/CDA1 family)